MTPKKGVKHGSSPLTSLVDLEGHLKQTGGDAQLLDELCEVVLANIPWRLRAMATALTEKDATEVERQLRSLRAGCASVGCNQVTVLTHLVESHARVDDFNGAHIRFSDLRRLVCKLAAELRRHLESR